MSRRDRRDGERRDDRRDDGGTIAGTVSRKTSNSAGLARADVQEGESLTALKGILAKVASLLKPLQLTPEESIRLVEQLYGSVLEMDLKLASESDDTRKSSVLAHIQNTVVRRDGDKLVVEYPAETAARGGAFRRMNLEAGPRRSAGLTSRMASPQRNLTRKRRVGYSSSK